MAESEQTLIERRDGGVATLLLNRPERKNALDRALVAALGERMTALAADPAVRCIVLGGQGGAFCSGADLKAAMSDPNAVGTIDQQLDAYHRIIRAITGAPQPVIAMVDGPAVGFGCDLALACDLRIVTTRAYFQEKFVRIGLMPDGGGTLWLARLVGLGRALEILFTGERVDADRAELYGLCNRVVAPEALEQETMALAQRFAASAPLALAAIKRAVRGALGASVEAALAVERDNQLRLLQSADFGEGVAAWLQNRDPKFEGR